MGQQIAAGISKSSTQIGTTLAGIGQNLTKTGRGLTTNLTLPLVAAGGAAAKFALDFDTTLRQVVGLTDVTQEEIAGIREEILALGPAVGKGPQELAEAFYFVASAGFAADEAMEVLKVSAQSAASGLGDTQTIAQVLGGVINAYGRENITAARAADILTEAVSQGTAEASGLASVIGNVVPGAAALGVSFDQVTAAMAGMTLTGVGVEESATSLIQIFSSLQKPTSQAEEALEGMGLSSAELRRQLREEGLLATLRTLEERFAGNETAAAAVFGNIRALRGVTSLLTLDNEQLNEVFAKVEDSLGRQATAYAETEGPARDIARSMADIEATAIQLGTDVLPIVVDVLGQIAGMARDLSKWWKSLDEDTRKQIVQWLAWVAVAGPVLVILGKLATAGGALFKVIGFLAGAKGIGSLLRLFKLLRTLSFAALGPLGLLAGALVVLYELLDGSDEAKQFESFAKKLGKSTKDLTKDLGKAGVSAEDFATMVEEAGGDVELAFQRMLKGVRKSVPDTAAAIREGGGQIVDAFGNTVVEPLDGATDDMVDDMGETPGEMADAMLANQFELGEAIDELIAFMEEAISPAQEAMNAAAFLASQEFRDGMNSGIPSVVTKTEELRDKALAVLDGSGVSGQIAWDGGRAIIGRWVGGMEYTLDARYDHFVTMVKRYADVLGGSLPEAGPLKGDTAERGGSSIAAAWIERGLIGGIREFLPKVASAVGQVGAALTTQGSLSLGLATAGVPSMGAMAAGASATVGAGSTTVNNTWQLVVNGVPYTFNTRDDFIKALDDLSAFGDGRIGG